MNVLNYGTKQRYLLLQMSVNDKKENCKVVFSDSVTLQSASLLRVEFKCFYYFNHILFIIDFDSPTIGYVLDKGSLQR